MNYQYTGIFQITDLFQDFRNEMEKTSFETVGDRRDGKVYLYTPKIILTLNIALATGRPLLVRGASGSGKSSLAYNVARILQRKYYEFVVTSRTQAQDLLWHFDAVRRLSDAQIRQEHLEDYDELWMSHYSYISPSVLWWIFDHDSASRRGLPINASIPRFFRQAIDPCYNVDFVPPDAPAVLLIDEIDKADPDIPNNLLVPLGSLEFRVDEINQKIEFDPPQNLPLADSLPLIIITTNEERQLPEAFVRRCIVLEIEPPNRQDRMEIALRTFENLDKQLCEDISDIMEILLRRVSSGSRQLEASVSIAEYLDAIRTCLKLNVSRDTETLMEIVKSTIWKKLDANP